MDLDRVLMDKISAIVIKSCTCDPGKSLRVIQTRIGLGGLEADIAAAMIGSSATLLRLVCVAGALLQSSGKPCRQRS